MKTQKKNWSKCNWISNENRTTQKRYAMRCNWESNKAKKRGCPRLLSEFSTPNWNQSLNWEMVKMILRPRCLIGWKDPFFRPKTLLHAFQNIVRAHKFTKLNFLYWNQMILLFTMSTYLSIGHRLESRKQ